MDGMDETPKMHPQIIDTSGLTPQMAAALHKAQQAVRRVAKGGENTYDRYKYATADDVIASARRACEGTGLSLVMMWGSVEPTRVGVNEASAQLASGGKSPGQKSPGSMVVGSLPFEALLIHAGDQAGMIRVRSSIDIVMARGKGAEKSAMAARTYAHGFILVSLLSMDRGGDPDDVDARNDAPADAPYVRQRADETFSEQQASRKLDQVARLYVGRPGGPEIWGVLRGSLGRPWSQDEAHTVAEYTAAIESLQRLMPAEAPAQVSGNAQGKPASEPQVHSDETQVHHDDDIPF